MLNENAKNAKMTNEEIDILSNRIIGLAINVHKQLGPGFVEKIYEKALSYEFKKHGITFIQQKVIRVKYEGIELGNQRIDFLIEGEVILEIKSASQIIEIYQDQILSYLKTSDKKLGLILNFGKKRLDIKRIVNKF
jgi:GxxExxY protein